MAGKHVKKIVKDYAKPIKIIGLVGIILSSLLLAICLISIIYIIAAYINISDSNYIKNIVNSVGLGYETQLNNNDISIGSQSFSLTEIFNLGLSFMTFISVFSALGCCYSIFCAIYMKSFCKNFTKYEHMFFLNVLGIAVSFISLNIFSMIYHIVASILICIYMIKSEVKFKTQQIIKLKVQKLMIRGNDLIQKHQH